MNSPIIHWHTHWEKNKPIFNSYAQQMDNFLRRIKGDYLKQVFKERVTKVYGGETEAKLILGLTNRLKNNSEIKKAVEQAFAEISKMKPFGQFGLSSQDFIDYYNKTTTKAKAINDYLQNLEQGFEMIYKFYGSNFNNIEGFYKYYAGKMKDAEFQQEVKQFTRNSNGELIAIESEQIKKLDSKAQGVLKSLSKIKIEGYQTSQFKDADSYLRVIKDYLNSGLRQLIGYAYEAQLFSTKMALDKKIVSILGPNAKMEMSGTKTSSEHLEYRQSTTDLKITSQGGQMKITVPIGISVKSYSPRKNGDIKLSVKDSQLGTLLDMLMSRTSILNQKQYEAMLNLMTNFRKPDLTKSSRKKRKDDKGQEKEYTTVRKSATAFEYKNMNALVHQMNKALMITGLAGSLSQKDLSTILIINDGVYNIADILGELGKKNSYKNALISGGITFPKIANVVSQHHFLGDSLSIEAQQKRSNEIEPIFKAMPIDLHLRLSKTLLAKLNKI